jgi:exopolysaccharide biosynthesis protein
MRAFLKRPYTWATLFTVVLTCAFVATVLYVFVVPRGAQAAATSASKLAQIQASGAASGGSAAGLSTDDDASSSDSDAAAGQVLSYQDSSVQITVTPERVDDTSVYVADIRVASVASLEAMLAGNEYGRNITATTSQMAQQSGAILAINGDFYGFRNYGYVLRNGTTYRTDDRSNATDLVLDTSGNMTCMPESSITSSVAATAWQVWSFGPALIEGGQVCVSDSSEVAGPSALSNPRTAIGQVGPLHYVMCVSGGRDSNDTGLSLLQLAQVMASAGCTCAYNLDGGGSSCMVFEGQVLNQQVNGRGRALGAADSSGERKVSDIIYIGE